MSPPTLNVLAISSHGGRGGSELAFDAFLAHRPASVAPTILVLGDGALVSALESRGEAVLVAGEYGGRPTPADVGRFTRQLRDLIRRERPDVVWAAGIKAALMAAPGARSSRVPIVWHKVDFSFDGSLAIPVAAAVNGVIGASSAVLDALGPLRRRALGVVFPPVELPEAIDRNPDRERLRIGMLARLTSYKGQHLVLRAAALLRPEFPRLRVTLAGDEADPQGGYRDSLVRLARELGIEEILELPGFVEAATLLPELDVLVNATHRDVEGFGVEGLGAATLEASWVGVPVVATKGGGTAEALVDGVTGTLVDDPEPEQLAAAIAPYLRDPQLNRRTGEAGRAFARARCETPERASRRLFTLLDSQRR